MCKMPIESSREKEFLSKILNLDNDPPEDLLEEKYETPKNFRTFLSTKKCDSEKLRREDREIRESI